MKYLVSLILAVIAAGCGSSKPGSSSATPNERVKMDRGDEIVAEYLKRDAAPYRKMRVRFTVKSADEPDKIFELDNWRKQTPEATTTLSQIVKPEEDSDLGSLTYERKGEKTVVVTYAPSRGEFRETDTHKMFFGGLTVGELLGDWDKYDFKQSGEKELDGRRVAVVDGKIKAGASSVAARMNVVFRSDNFVPVEIHLFDINDREIRSYRSVEFNDDQDHPYASKTEVDNPVYKATITIEILSREFPAKIDDSMFEREILKRTVRK